METFLDGSDGIAHDKFQEWRRQHPSGFFINCKGRRWMLHMSPCPHPGDNTIPASKFGSLTAQKKVCSTDPKELTRYAIESKRELVLCSDCRPQLYAAKAKDGTECFSGVDHDPPMLSDFWRWAMSDLLSNTTRGILAEYLVAKALGATGKVRGPWSAVDIKIDGLKVEVKASAYVQAWFGTTLSSPSFGIAPTREWSEKNGKMEKVRKRQADVYVLCLLANKDRGAVNPMDVSQWEFYVLPTSWLNDTFGKDRKRISMTDLETRRVQDVTYDQLTCDKLKEIVDSGEPTLRSDAGEFREKA